MRQKSLGNRRGGRTPGKHENPKREQETKAQGRKKKENEKEREGG